MNEIQTKLFEVICGIFSVENIEKHYSESVIRYGILNYIAKFSLANDQYFVTEKSKKHLIDLGILRDGKLRRGSKSTKLNFTYEHPIPCAVIGSEIIKNYKSPEEIKYILEWSDKVTVLTSEENNQLNIFYRSDMPTGWKFFENSPFERYEKSGVVDPKSLSKISVFGKVIR